MCRNEFLRIFTNFKTLGHEFSIGDTHAIPRLCSHLHLRFFPNFHLTVIQLWNLRESQFGLLVPSIMSPINMKFLWLSDFE